MQTVFQIKKLVGRGQSHIEDKYPSSDDWRISYRTGNVLESTRLLQRIW